ncbi:MAG: FAD:protein FMN transferase [Rhodospirillales bacterium]|jgi:thiamine biosynthesis lipoprotein|nr:FAD:protein FMN transferase [Rhodospirillales bacterium]
MTVKFTRRRALTVLAAAAGVPLFLTATRAQAKMVRWEGTALGAPASISLYHKDEAKAHAAIEAGLAELARLETIFSVYRADSILASLNRDGRVEKAPKEFIELLTRALSLAEKSEGIYDPTIQPLWQTYFRHFTSANPDPSGPSLADIDAARSLVGWRQVEVNADAGSVAFAKPGMGLTLNSGAQGFITDRVADLLRAHGFTQTIVDMGEPRALDAKPDGSAWRIGIANPANPAQAITEIDVVNKCVSTSGGYGTLFDDAGKFTHLIDPRTGKTAPALLGVSVVAPTATQADGLSAALLLADAGKRQSLLRAMGGEMALVVTPEGVAQKVEA